MRLSRMSAPKCQRGSTQLAWSAAQLAIILLLQHAVAAAQPQTGLAARSSAAAALDPDAPITTTTTSSTTTSTLIVEQREEKTTVPATNAAATTLAPAAASGTGPASWMPAVTRPPKPSPLPSAPLAPAVDSTNSTSPPLAPAAAGSSTSSSNSSSSSSSSGGMNTGDEKYSNMAETNGANAPLGNTTTTAAGAGARTGTASPVLDRQPAAVVAAVTEAAGTAAAGGAAAGGTTAGAAKNATFKIWKPTYPFPQCANTTLSYDISFVGALKRIQVGSVNYAYHRFGPLNPGAHQPPPILLSSVTKPNNAPVVFISGWGTSMYMWPVPLIQRLAESREVIIFDNMRTGFSTDSSYASLTIPMMADSTAALIDKLGLQQPSIWGWSVGGIVAYALLALHSSKVGSVVIAAGSPGGPDALLPPVPVTQEIINLQQNYTALLPFLFAEGVKSPGVCGFYAAYNSFYASRFTTLSTPLGENSLREQSLAVVKFFRDPTVINGLTGTTNRVLILHGVQDQLMPVRNALLGVWKLLGAWMLQFPGEGHGFPFSYIQGVINTTLQFFSLASPLSSAEIMQWDTYGDTAATRGTGIDTTLVVRAEAVGQNR